MDGHNIPKWMAAIQDSQQRAEAFNLQAELAQLRAELAKIRDQKARLHKKLMGARDENKRLWARILWLEEAWTDCVKARAAISSNADSSATPDS